MRLAQITRDLRDTSDRYGGIPEYLQAAGDLDAAISDFFMHQDTESLQRVNGALAKCDRLLKWRREAFNAPVAR